MSKAVYLGIDNISRKLSAMYVGVDGVARKIKAGYVGVNGVARQFYSYNNKILKAGTYTWNDNLAICTWDYWTFPLVFTSNGESFTNISTSYGNDLYYNDTQVYPSYNEEEGWYEGWIDNYKTFTIPYDQDGSEDTTGGCSCGGDFHTIYDIIVANTDYLAVNGGSACLVTYNLTNDGYMSESTSKVVSAGTTIILPTPYPYSSDDYFGYWRCSNGGTYSAGATYTVNSDVTFTAVWGHGGGSTSCNHNGGYEYRSNGNGTHNVYCASCGETLQSHAFCVYEQGLACMYCGAPKPSDG
jgi:hypothetical protein